MIFITKMEFRELSLPIKIVILSSPFLIGGLVLYLDENYQNLSEYIQGAFILLQIVAILGWLFSEKK